MKRVLRPIYAATLAAWLVPASISRLLKHGPAAIRWRELLALDVPSTAQSDPNPLWIHAVSVGELNAAAQLLTALAEQKLLPLTCTTEAGRVFAANQLERQARMPPLDFATVVERFLRLARPRACLLMEQEIWPNIVRLCAAKNIPIAIANGRMSKRSARRHARCFAFTGHAFQALSGVAAQTRPDARRFRALGVRQVVVTGNVKHDATPDQAQIARGIQLGDQLRGQHDRPIILAASTRPGEEELLLPALRAILPEAVLLLVPRHPERCTQVAKLLGQNGYAFKRTTELAANDTPACLLGDTMGEMACYIAAADLVFVGGSLRPFGGQNVMEVMAQGKPAVVGPYTSNIAEEVRVGTRAGAIRQAQDAISVAQALVSWPSREIAAAAGRAISINHRGAAKRTAQAIATILGLTP